jgi:ureidoacrylate peracid hydrolase
MASRIITIRAKPEAIDIDTTKTAVIVVDMQNDFATEGGLFDHAGVDITGAKKAIPHIQSTLATARGADIPIIYLKMGFQPDLSDLGAEDSVNRVRHLHFGVGQTAQAPDGTTGRFLIRDTWNTDIVPELEPQPKDLVMYKTRFSGFYQTELNATLKKMGAKYLIFVGVTTCICVDSTVRDAMFRDYLCVLLSDCMSEPIGDELPRSNHDAALLSLQTLFGWVSDSRKFVNAFGSNQPLQPSASQLTESSRMNYEG